MKFLGIHQRCKNPKASGYANYGGRSIRVCDRWNDFAAFLADVGERPSSKHSLDRINNDGNYEPGNCRWATRVEQNNNRRSNISLTIDDTHQTLAQWVDHFGLVYVNVHKAISIRNQETESELDVLMRYVQREQRKLSKGAF